MLLILSNFVFMYLVPCCDVHLVFHVERCSVLLYSHLFCSDSCIFMLFVFIYVYSCNTIFILDDFRAVNSNKTSATANYLSRTPPFIPVFSGVRVIQYLVFCVVCFVHICLPFCHFSIVNFISCPSLIYGF